MQPYLCQRCHANSGHPGTLYDKNNAVGGPLVANAPPAGVTTTQTIVSPRILSRGCPELPQPDSRIEFTIWRRVRKVTS